MCVEVAGAVDVWCPQVQEYQKRREFFEARRAADMDDILERIDQVEVERAYRIIGMLEATLGQLYLVILVARLVGYDPLLARPRSGRESLP